MTTAIPLKFRDWLAKQLTSLEKQGGNNSMQGKKYYILDMAFRQFWDMGCSPPADASVLGPDADKYKIGKSASPDHFSKDTFRPKHRYK